MMHSCLKPHQKNLGVFWTLFAVCLCVVYLSSVSNNTTQEEEGFGFCDELVDYALQGYKEVALQRNNLHQEKYVEEQKWKKQLTDMSSTLRDSELNCTMGRNQVMNDLGLCKTGQSACQKSVKSLRENLERNSAAMITILRALRDAEEKNSRLEHELADLRGGSDAAGTRSGDTPRAGGSRQ